MSEVLAQLEKKGGGGEVTLELWDSDNPTHNENGKCVVTICRAAAPEFWINSVKQTPKWTVQATTSCYSSLYEIEKLLSSDTVVIRGRGFAIYY